MPSSVTCRTIPSIFPALRIISSVYGVRLGELAKLESKHIDIEKRTITFYVEKRRYVGGKPITQPIPEELLPYFMVPIWKRSPREICDDLKRIARKAGVKLQHRQGIHAIRRQVVSTVYDMESLKQLDIQNFLRWSTSSSGMLPTYVQKPTEQSDKMILNQHPLAEPWKIWCVYLDAFPQFQDGTLLHNCAKIQ